MTLFTRFSALVLAFCLALPAMAMSLDEAKNALESAKSQGLVGETPSGYLAAVSADQKAQDIVSAINDARREAYKEIAEKHGIAVTKVETVAGQKAVEKTPAGQYIWVGERWIKK
ncbi:YdbL family protein [Marinobacter sp. 1-3A]|uniref:YdbL family protein n=1 Tax=Marinobacter sp. 1-3A TaxID=2582920 RepID=UPI001908D7A5|nr:YdbL family protein [Marinobacter sp. 1-3A]MBK1872008.1 YdbL family protein [Marinobacter sp. 1-3A]